MSFESFVVKVVCRECSDAGTKAFTTKVTKGTKRNGVLEQGKEDPSFVPFESFVVKDVWRESSDAGPFLDSRIRGNDPFDPFGSAQGRPFGFAQGELAPHAQGG